MFRRLSTMMLLVSLLALMLPVGLIRAAEPSGCWIPESGVGARLDIRDDGTFSFGVDAGRWAVQADEIWLLGSDDAGTKWHFEVVAGKLTLDRPEDFKYLGSGEYMYFQMTDPKSDMRFESGDAEACAEPGTVDRSPEGHAESMEGGTEGSEPATKEEAREIFEAATEAYQDGNYREALALFLRVRQVLRMPQVDYNIARCLELVGECSAAVAELEKLVTHPDTNDTLRKQVESKLQELGDCSGAAP